MQHKAVITGIGLLSSLGEGAKAHIKPQHPNLVDFAPYTVFGLKQPQFDTQMSKKDMRQMEAWQRIGVYAAGLALDTAGLKGKSEFLAKMNMIVAAGGGERDEAVDEALLTALQTQNDKQAYLNEKLMSELRPTLFLSQLSNLLAGNISIVHGVVGSSRTFMGEEQAGVDAVRIAVSRIQAGQGDLFLVGGSYNAERKDILLHYELAGMLKTEKRDKGMTLGSAGAFLVIESETHAKLRGAKIIAEITNVQSLRKSSLETLTQEAQALVSVQSGLQPPFKHPKETYDVTAHIGHTMEAAFPFGVAIAALQGGGEVLSIAHVSGIGYATVKGLPA
jgi:3-oxoacyl-[acyl-carrier-protein] synthase II